VLIYAASELQVSLYAFALGLHYRVSVAHSRAEFLRGLKGADVVLLIVGNEAGQAVQLGKLARRRRLRVMAVRLEDCACEDLEADAVVSARLPEHMALLRAMLARRSPRRCGRKKADSKRSKLRWARV
jgi:hypothetical protein